MFWATIDWLFWGENITLWQMYYSDRKEDSWIENESLKWYIVKFCDKLGQKRVLNGYGRLIFSLSLGW